MSDRDWGKELAKIDKQLESVSDQALYSGTVTTSTAPRAEAPPQRRGASLGVFARLGLSVVLGVGIVFWPYEARCGVGLAAYLVAVVAVATSGIWSAVWTWRHRTGRAHALSLLLILWGLVLGAVEVLPRVGYAKPMVAHPATWACR